MKHNTNNQFKIYRDGKRDLHYAFKAYSKFYGKLTAYYSYKAFEKVILVTDTLVTEYQKI